MQMMNIDLNKVREHLVHKDKTLALAQGFVENYFKDAKDNDVNRILRFWSNSSLKTNIERIYSYAESEIEKIFLNSLNFTAFLHSSFLIVFTPKFDSASEAIAFFRNRDDQIMSFLREFEKLSGKNGTQEFIDWIDQLTDIPYVDKMTIKTHITMYDDLGLKDAYHVSVQAAFKDIKVAGKFIRPDMFLWIPSKPEFKLIVECDGFAYHSDKLSFSRDRSRDRLLQSKGFQVFRFSGPEIFNDPVGKAIELCNYLFEKREAGSIHNNQKSKK